MLYLDIFDTEKIHKTPFVGVTHARDIDYIRRLYVFNRDSIQNYYQERNFSVKNTHILSRILEHFPVYLGYDTYRYLEFVDNKLTYLAKHYKFSSDIEKGVLHPPYFFGNHGDEVILSGYEDFNALDFVRNWKTEPCLKVLKHPRNDDKMLLPLGTDDGNRSGLSSVFLDIPKLAVKYREFVREQTVSEANERPLLSKNHFVLKYVLSSSMESVIDHTLLNKLMDKFYGRETIEPSKKHPFKLFEPDGQIDRYLENTLDTITSKPLELVSLLRNIKLVFHEDASLLLGLPDISGTRQIKPAVIASRIEHMVFLLDVCKNKNLNKHHFNDWSRLAARLLSDNALNGFFTYEIESDIKEKLYRIKNG